MKSGPLFEKHVVEYLNAHGHPKAERYLRSGGVNDPGDVRGVDAWAIECKAEKRMDIATALREAEREALALGVPNFVAVLKRRQKSVAEAYCVLPLWLMSGLMLP